MAVKKATTKLKRPWGSEKEAPKPNGCKERAAQVETTMGSEKEAPLEIECMTAVHAA